MYGALREALDRSGTRQKAKRGNIHFTEAGELCLKPGSSRTLSDNEVNQYLIKYQRDFPNAVIDIPTYAAIDQGEEGACSFVGFLNLACLTGNEKQLKKGIVKGWKRAWTSFGMNDSLDIATTLDAMIAKKMVKPEHIHYTPFRSAGAGENNFNTDFWDPVNTKARYHLDQRQYDEAPFLYEIGNFVETHIDMNIPLEINAMCHSRVCVGYNDTSLLFADNWEHAYTQTMSGMGNLVDFDVYAAGFSMVPKWGMYSAMRDLVHF